jgi:hypothetical protein
MRGLVIGLGAFAAVIVGIFFLAAVMQRGQYQPPSEGGYLPECALGKSASDPRDCEPK